MQQRGRRFCLCLCVQTVFPCKAAQVCVIVVSAGLQAGDGECSVSDSCHINRLQMVPFLLLYDMLIHFDAGPSSTPTDMKTVAPDSWSLIKSPAFLII